MLGTGDSEVVNYVFRCLFRFSCYKQVPQLFIHHYRCLIFFEGANFKFNSVCPNIFKLRYINLVSELTLVRMSLCVAKFIYGCVHPVI